MKGYDFEALKKIDQRLDDLIRVVNDGVGWASTFLKEHAAQRTAFRLKTIRRDLKRIKATVLEKPSSALYGESQVGKSYLVKNLLSKEGEPFYITDRSTTKEYDFLAQINPRGDGVEATGVVTRFSTQVDILDAQYPIKIKLLAPRDVLLMLCDTYFLDIVHHTNLPSKEEIQDHVQTLKQIYGQAPLVQEVFSEDDVYELKDYFDKYFPNFASAYNDGSFWTEVGELISRVDSQDWSQVFEILWSRNQFISNIFDSLIMALKEVNFTPTLFSQFSAILREHGSLLHVARLKDLGGEYTYEDTPDRSKFQAKADVIFLSSNGQRQKASLEKSTLSALIAELILEVNSELESHKPFLKDTDLLDFPGARSRNENREDRLNEFYIGGMVLRGKVSYIFNKYSSQDKISNLLFCNKNIKIEVTYISRLLNDWIETYIGPDVQSREKFLQNSPFPPLFIIYTFFNEDMEYDPNKDTETNLSEKWTKRFYTIFEREILTKNYSWHREWTLSQPYFQNNYLLRDYQYSDKIFDGFQSTHNRETRVKEVGIPNYHEALKQSFLDFEFVQNHFQDPRQAWNRAATLNQDGSELIIENLARVSNNLARTDKFVRDIERMRVETLELLKQFYHDDDADKNIRKAAQTAGEIHLNIDTLFSQNPFAFGRFIKSFLIRESDCYNFYKESLNSLELVQKKDLNPYVLIRNSVVKAGKQLSGKHEDYDRNLVTLMETYHLPNRDAVEEFFKDKAINLNELFFGEGNIIKSNSQILAESLKDFWFSTHLKHERFQALLDMGFPPSSLEDIFDNIRITFAKLGVVEIIALNIRQFVDRYDQIEAAQEMIADISAAIVNKFITGMGWDFYGQEDLADVRQISRFNHLNLDLDFASSSPEGADDEEIAELFDKISNYDQEVMSLTADPDVTNHFPNLYHISLWREKMKVAFIFACNVPSYDPLANQELGKILTKMTN